MLKLRISVAVLLVALVPAVAHAASLSVAWDRNTEPDVSGYLVLVGSTPGGTDQTIDVGTQTSWTLPSAVPGKTYYFRVQAYTSTGLRSLDSTEVFGAAVATSAPPFGSFDTPGDNATGLTGSVAITGWALDDGAVTRVRIMRAPVAGEAAGSLVYIGDASLVPGARPDIAAMFPGTPQTDRAGWGYLMLSNFLPNLGNGTFRLYAYADDSDGHSTLLGMKTITCANANSVTPFGAIDTPGQGQSVSSVVNNYGWVLAPGARRANPLEGGTVQVVIDGAAVGSPTGWTSRSDLTGYFPVALYSGISHALGVYSFDSRTLSNGIHTLAWAVTDNMGGTTGVGSRYFTVSNGSGIVSAAVSADTSAAPALSADAASSASLTWLVNPLVGRRGFDLSAPVRTYRANASGIFVVQAEELDRVELYTAATSAALVTPNGTRPLPIGAGLDGGGVFRWQPGVGFAGPYDFLFTGPDGERHVSIVLNPKGSGRVGPQIAIDTPSAGSQPFVLSAGAPFNVAGWAADLDANWQTGVDTVHVWAYPRSGADPIFLGQAALGGARPDVAAIYGDAFKPSGYGLTSAGLPAGDYDLAVFAWSTVLEGFAPARTVAISVR